MAEDWVDTADHRPDVYLENGRLVFRASSFGNCDANLVRQGVGQTAAPAPEFMLGKFEESARLEAEVLARFEAQCGMRMLRTPELEGRGLAVDERSGQVELELKVPGGIIRCHPDGLAKRFKVEGAVGGDRPELGKMYVVEAKAMASGSGDPLTKNPNYSWQMAIEMAGTKLPGVFVVGWKDGAGGLSDEPLSVTWFDEPPHSLGEIKVRARMLAQLIRHAEEGNVGEAFVCTRKQYPCGFWGDHDQESGLWAKADVEEFEDLPHEILKAIGTWHLAELEVKRHAADRDEAKAAVLGYMKDRNIVGARRAGLFVVTRQVEATTKMDKAAAKADGVDLDKYRVAGNGRDFVALKVEDET